MKASLHSCQEEAPRMRSSQTIENYREGQKERLRSGTEGRDPAMYEGA